MSWHINHFCIENPKTDSLAISEDPDKMTQSVCEDKNILQGQKKNRHNLQVLTCIPSKFIMDIPIGIVPIFMGKSCEYKMG